MGRSVNQVTLLGRLTRDPELKTTPTGKSVTSFTLAVDKQSGDGAHFFDVTAWEKLADLVEQYTKKGSKVLVLGRLQQQTWEQDGNKRSKVTVTANDVTFLDSKSEPTSSVPKDSKNKSVSSDDAIDMSDIPF